jgi:hypothetical protein
VAQQSFLLLIIVILDSPLDCRIFVLRVFDEDLSGDKLD